MRYTCSTCAYDGCCDGMPHCGGTCWVSAIDGLPNITETDARSIELIAKYAINHSMYGGGIILSMTGAVREVKRVIAKQRGGAA